jgi:hypothetical protein
MHPEVFRDAVCRLPTRRFGILSECLCRRLLGAPRSTSSAYDLGGPDRRIECKFSVARHRSPRFESDDLLASVARFAAEGDRLLAFDQWSSADFACNIQCIKPSEFDLLYYGIFFSDLIAVFSAESGLIGTPCLPAHPQAHHSTHLQFHLNRFNLSWHLRERLHATITWVEVVRLLDSTAH